MNRKSCILWFFILLVYSSCNFSKPEPSLKQQEFAQKLLETPGILKTEWVTTNILDVIVELDRLGTNPKLKAKELADQIASAGYDYTGKDLCVYIYYPSLNKLADSCSF